MIFNNLRLSARQLYKNRLFTFINVFGLAVGLAAGLLLFRIVEYERSFNGMFSNSERIVRVITREFTPEGETQLTAGLPISAQSVIENTITEFEQTCRAKEVWPTIGVPDANGDASRKKFGVKSDGSEIAFYTEPAFLTMFDWKWLAGDKTSALKEPNSVVLTRSWADKCFGSWDKALNQTVVLDNATKLSVKGVVDDPPVNCDLPFRFLVSYSTLPKKDEDWGSISSNDQFYGLLKNAKYDLAALNTNLAKVGEEKYKQMGGGFQDKKHMAQPLNDLHYNEEVSTSGSHIIPKSRLWILSSIGLLILLMACFNFVNLATAQATLRAREVGVRKTLGSNRGQLIVQFLTETAMVVFAAVALGAAMAFLLSPALKYFSEVPSSWPFLSKPAVWAFLGLAAIVITLVSGLYPSLVLAGFNPIRALRRDAAQQTLGGFPVRKVLVVGQFVIAQALIVGTLVTLQQLDYLRNKDLGFTKDLIYTFNFMSDSSSLSKLDVLKQRIMSVSGVTSVSFSSDVPSSSSTWNGNFSLGRGKDDAPFNVSYKFCDADFANNYGLKLAAGRWLQPCDTLREAVVNETLLRKLNVKPEEAIGQEIVLGRHRVLPIVGVLKDFHSHSLHEPLEAMMLSTKKKNYSTAGVKIQPSNMNETVASVQKIYEETFPEQIFEGEYFDERIAEFYRDETRFSYTCRAFAGLAILISCLGLFGLAAHAASRRTKEIGIRKVLGATVAGITGLLARDFLRLVVIALVIATPFAWYFMNQWLENFAYRVDVKWWLFLVTGMIAIMVAFATVSFQSIRAALGNPVKALRSE